jgi:hypothetical protein
MSWLRLLVGITALAPAWAVDFSPAPGAAADFDPGQGVAENGRIPKVPLPIVTEHPERYRYIPEGRLLPGGPLDRLFVSFFPTPIFYFREAVGAGGGVGLVDIDFRGQRRQEFLGLFVAASTQGQETYRAVWQRWLDHHEVPGGGVVQSDRSFLRISSGYTRTRTRRFFGLGSSTQARDETNYTDEAVEAVADLEHVLPMPWGDVVVLGSLRGVRRNLASGRLPDTPSTEWVHPELVAQADGRASGWVGGGLRYDTRDSTENPYHGLSLEARADAAPVQSLGAGSGGIGTLKATWAITVPGLAHDGGAADRLASGSDEENPPTDAVVVGARMRSTWGDVAFTDLPNLGGADTLRGYLGDRWTDRAAWNAGVEWRIWLVPRGLTFTRSIRIERLGIAPFADLGAVAGRVQQFDRSPPKWALGTGLRVGFERNAIFRIDLARSPEQFAVNIDFGMPF